MAQKFVVLVFVIVILIFLRYYLNNCLWRNVYDCMDINDVKFENFVATLLIAVGCC